MRSFNRQGATHRDGLRIGLKVGQPVENGGVVEFFFGNDGNESLHYDKFSKFLKELHDEVICYFHSESTHIDTDIASWIDLEGICIILIQTLCRHMRAYQWLFFPFIVSIISTKLSELYPFKYEVKCKVFWTLSCQSRLSENFRTWLKFLK